MVAVAAEQEAQEQRSVARLGGCVVSLSSRAVGRTACATARWAMHHSASDCCSAIIAGAAQPAGLARSGLESENESFSGCSCVVEGGRCLHRPAVVPQTARLGFSSSSDGLRARLRRSSPFAFSLRSVLERAERRGMHCRVRKFKSPSEVGRLQLGCTPSGR